MDIVGVSVKESRFCNDVSAPRLDSLRHGWTRSAISAPATDEKECAKAHSRAKARLLRQPSTTAPSAHPRSAFYFIGRIFL